MSNNPEVQIQSLQSQENNEQLHKPYHEPILEELGDLRTVTLAGSVVSVADSGTPFNRV
jgi:hypothetical protein